MVRPTWCRWRRRGRPDMGDWCSHRAPTYRLLDSHCSPFALNDDADASSTSGSLSTTTPSALHFAVIAGCVASSILAGPHREWVSCILALPLAVHQGHV